ncbi:hypothetical protein [Amycolatopsis pigmentata]|uniref:Transposase n=1 Tax=Amycolatopsis pigmentata TaxID=450801 RepID=A0ABW5FMI7_9PSEU
MTCRVLGISRQANYQWCSAPVSQRDWDDAHLINAGLDIQADGYRFIADEIAQRGFTLGEASMAALLDPADLSSHPRKKARSRKAGPPVHDDLVRRDFAAEAPNVKWLTDITERPTDRTLRHLPHPRCRSDLYHDSRRGERQVRPVRRAAGRVVSVDPAER